jgi:hypothetical protein
VITNILPLNQVDMKLWKSVVAFVAVCGLFAFRSDTIELEKKSLLGNRIELKIPKGFGSMPEAMAKLKYPAERRPTLILANEDCTVSVALKFTSDKATQAQLPTIKENLMHTFRHRYMSAIMKYDNIKEVNGRKVAFMEFSTPGVEYNLVFFTDLDGQLLLGTFNCTDKKNGQWQPVAQEIMASLKLK